MGIIHQAEALLADDLASGTLIRVPADYQPKALPVHIGYAATRAPTPELRSFIDLLAATLL